MNYDDIRFIHLLDHTLDYKYTASWKIDVNVLYLTKNKLKLCWEIISVIPVPSLYNIYLYDNFNILFSFDSIITNILLKE